MRRIIEWFVFLVLLATVNGMMAADAGIAAVLADLVKEKKIVGAQFAFGSGNDEPKAGVTGTDSPATGQQVREDTLFCIGSCSKPLASAMTFRLIQSGRLELTDAVDRWLPEFSNPKLSSGKSAARPPNLSELLSHRAGIYSQRNRLTPEQVNLIRDFTQTLDQSVSGISHQPLLGPPGRQYAYSGAGYVVLGGIIERAGSGALEDQLQMLLCQPLKMNNTTWFPNRRQNRAAAGGVILNRQLKPNPQTPHLTGARPKFPLVGGSLYSTAIDLSKFCQMILGRGTLGKTRVMNEQTWRQWVSKPFSQNYGYGWQLIQNPSGGIVGLSHGGSLASSRALIRVNLETKRYCVAVYTLTTASEVKSPQSAGNQIARAAVVTVGAAK